MTTSHSDTSNLDHALKMLPIIQAEIDPQRKIPSDLVEKEKKPDLSDDFKLVRMIEKKRLVCPICGCGFATNNRVRKYCEDCRPGK